MAPTIRLQNWTVLISTIMYNLITEYIYIYIYQVKTGTTMDEKYANTMFVHYFNNNY